MGATFYRCITGVLLPDSVQRGHNDSAQRPSALGARLPVQAENAIMKAVAPMAKDRFPNMESFIDALTGAPSTQAGHASSQRMYVQGGSGTIRPQPQQPQTQQSGRERLCGGAAAQPRPALEPGVRRGAPLGPLHRAAHRPFYRPGATGQQRGRRRQRSLHQHFRPLDAPVHRGNRPAPGDGRDGGAGPRPPECEHMGARRLHGQQRRLHLRAGGARLRGGGQLHLDL